jgi:hypothetical protein
LEQIIRERTFPELKSHLLGLKLSPLLRIAFIMLLGFALVTMSVRALAQYSLSLPNPFPAYADIFPGQAASMAEARGFSCQRSYDYYDATEDHVPTLEACIFAPPEGIFSSVQVIISDGIIRESIFLIRNNTLQVGDVERFLEMPVLHTLHRTAYFFLPGSFVIVQTVGYARQFSLFLPAWSISFTDRNLLEI